jgi:hypothetical protein
MAFSSPKLQSIDRLMLASPPDALTCCIHRSFTSFAHRSKMGARALICCVPKAGRMIRRSFLCISPGRIVSSTGGVKRRRTISGQQTSTEHGLEAWLLDRVLLVHVWTGIEQMGDGCWISNLDVVSLCAS